MSDYRDDTQETAVASSKVFALMSSITESSAFVLDKLMLGLMFVVVSTANAQDSITDSIAYTFTDSAIVHGSAHDRLETSYLHRDKAVASDAITSKIGVVHEDTAKAVGEALVGITRIDHNDSSAIHDSTYNTRIVSSLSTSSAKVRDVLTALTSDILTDLAVASDFHFNKLSAIDVLQNEASIGAATCGSTRVIAADAATAFDEILANRLSRSIVVENAIVRSNPVFVATDVFFDSCLASAKVLHKHRATSLLLDSASVADIVSDSRVQRSNAIATAMALDEPIDRLSAIGFFESTVVAYDTILSTGGYKGSAWTANVDTWAMSRYEPYNFTGLATIDGIIYGESEDGVYRLDQSDRQTTAKIKTGSMDLGEGTLTHPVSAYLEYSLNGHAGITVRTTQKGYEQSYDYVLPSESSSELTNGRFIFGRGLRGRHFSFELTLTGTHGHINDLTVEHAPTKRRV